MFEKNFEIFSVKLTESIYIYFFVQCTGPRADLKSNLTIKYSVKK